MVRTTKITKQQAEKASKQFVDGLKLHNPEPTGELRVSDADYTRLQRTLTKKLVDIAE